MCHFGEDSAEDETGGNAIVEELANFASAAPVAVDVLYVQPRMIIINLN